MYLFGYFFVIGSKGFVFFERGFGQLPVCMLAIHNVTVEVPAVLIVIRDLLINHVLPESSDEVCTHKSYSAWSFLRRSTMTQTLAMLKLERSAVAASMVRGQPTTFPIKRKHCLSKRNRGKLGRAIHTGVNDTSTSGPKSGV